MPDPSASTWPASASRASELLARPATSSAMRMPTLKASAPARFAAWAWVVLPPSATGVRITARAYDRALQRAVMAEEGSPSRPAGTLVQRRRIAALPTLRDDVVVCRRRRPAADPAHDTQPGHRDRWDHGRDRARRPRPVDRRHRDAHDHRAARGARAVLVGVHRVPRHVDDLRPD